MTTNPEYEAFVIDILDMIGEMRSTGDFDENTLETIEWRISPPKVWDILPPKVTFPQPTATEWANLVDEISEAQANYDKHPNSRDCQMYLNGLLMANSILKGEID